MFRNPASFLKAFFGFFTAFGAVFLAIGLGVGFTAPDGIIFLLAFGLAGLTFLLVGVIGLAVARTQGAPAPLAARKRPRAQRGLRRLRASDLAGDERQAPLCGALPLYRLRHPHDLQLPQRGPVVQPRLPAGGPLHRPGARAPDDYRKYYVDLGDLTNGYKVVG